MTAKEATHRKYKEISWLMRHGVRFDSERSRLLEAESKFIAQEGWREGVCSCALPSEDRG